MFRSPYYLNVLLRMNCRPVPSEYTNCWLFSERKMETVLRARKAAFPRWHKKKNACGKYLCRRSFIKLQILKTGKRKKFSIFQVFQIFQWVLPMIVSEVCSTELNWRYRPENTFLSVFIKYYSVKKS